MNLGPMLRLLNIFFNLSGGGARKKSYFKGTHNNRD